MRNGAKIATLAIEFFSLSLPTRLVLELSNCYFILNITKNIIFISYLVTDDFTFEIRNKRILIFRNKIFFGSANVINKIYILNMQSLILNIETKRAKLNNTIDSYL